MSERFVPRPGLYLVATPIGNRRDITMRAMDVLEACDVVACEDTRVTGALLSDYGFKKKLLRCDEFAEKQKANEIIAMIREGKVVALCSDAGSPLISDPGYPLVKAIREAGLLITTLPGASSVIAALQLSALPPQPFTFLGFVPQKGRDNFFKPWADVESTLVLFERSSRLDATVESVRKVLGEREIVLTRELTKLYEEVIPITGDAPEVKGECVLVIGPPAPQAKLSRNDLYKQKLVAKQKAEK